MSKTTATSPLHGAHACDGLRRMTRRQAVGRSSVAGGAFVAASWLTQFAESLARESESNSRPKSLLMIWLQGGPSQLETFDPHPGTLIGGDTKQIATSVPGLSIADSLPATAQRMHHTCLVRSMFSQEGDHERATYHLKTGWRPDPTIVHPAIGSIVCHSAEGNLEIPRHISISPSQWPARAGYLGPKYDAFQIGDPAEPIPNLTSRVPRAQMQSRIGPLLDAVETEFQRGRLRNLDTSRTLHQAATQNAVKMMSSEQLAAFDLSLEGASTRNQFGDTAFGRGLLAAIRLLSAGVRCVEVELSGWDSHINNHQLQQSNATILDTALAATLDELVARDMLDDTLVFCGGEFGRTPRINPAAGRDHWPHGFSTLLAGGNLRRGYVHGQTAAKLDTALLEKPNRQAPEKFASEPVSVPDLHATMLHALGVNPEAERTTPIGRPLRWSDGSVVKALLA